MNVIFGLQNAHFFEYYDPISLSNNIDDWDDEIRFSRKADLYEKSQLHSVHGLILANNVCNLQ